jgi:hypothetical protein
MTIEVDSQLENAMHRDEIDAEAERINIQEIQAEERKAAAGMCMFVRMRTCVCVWDMFH